MIDNTVIVQVSYEVVIMISDRARIINDLESVISTISPDIDLSKLKIRVEEITSNYNISRKSNKEIENDIHEKIELYL